MRRKERRRRNEEVVLAGPITEGAYEGLVKLQRCWDDGNESTNEHA
jgi:hypothetical protein